MKSSRMTMCAIRSLVTYLVVGLAVFGGSVAAYAADAYLEFVRRQADTLEAAYPVVSRMEDWTARRAEIRAALVRA